MEDHATTSSLGGGRHSPEKGVWGCVALKTPFSHLSCTVHKTLSWGISPFTRLIKINVKFCLIQQFSENNFLDPEAPMWPQFVKKLRNVINYQFSSPCWWKSVHKSPLSQQSHKPPSSKIRAAITYQKISWVPPPGLQPKLGWKLDLRMDLMSLHNIYSNQPNE